ncbi:MAG: pyridoxal-phosphate dependent enzyme, partial [Antricoccus sp.]
SLGAEVHIHGTEYADAAVAAADYIGRSGAVAMHAYDLLDMVAGAGTAALELTEQAGAFDDVCIAVGGGGWLGGLAAILPTGTAVGIEPTGVPTLHAALANNRPVDVEVDSVAADSLGARQLGQIAFDIAAQAQVRSILVDDPAIIEARNWLWRELRLAVEHAAATALAPLITGTLELDPDRRVAVLLCGANTELATIEVSEQ